MTRFVKQGTMWSRKREVENKKWQLSARISADLVPVSHEGVEADTVLIGQTR